MVLCELRHGLNHDFRFLPRELESFLILPFFVPNKFQEKGYVVGPALVANALHPGMFFIIDLWAIGGSVIEKNLDAVSAGFLQAPY